MKDLLFWAVILFTFVPRVGVFILEAQLNKRIISDSLVDGWTVRNEGGLVMKDNLTLPKDMRNIPGFGSQGTWIFEKEIKSTVLSGREPALVLGRIADADVVYLDDCEVGRTGLRMDERTTGWWWGALRAYRIPPGCRDLHKSKYLLRVHVRKIGANNAGIYAGPMGTGQWTEVEPFVRWSEGLRFSAFAIFGGILLAIGVYFGFLTVLIPGQRAYLAFAICSATVGIFAFMTSALPFRMFDNLELVMRVHLINAVIASIAFLCFLAYRFSVIRWWLIRGAGAIGSLAILFALARDSFDSIYRVYELWFPFLLLSFAIGYVQFATHWLRSRRPDMWRYLLGYSVFMLACFHDIGVTTIGAAGTPYLIPAAFFTVVVAAALTLAKEYADAFLHVEEQVKDRTRDLASALDQLRSLERMKERFFANVSHDFKTPIAVALGAIEEAKSAALEPAVRNLKKLLGMVTKMLDTIKAEGGALKLDWEDVLVVDFIERVADSCRILCKRQGIELRMNISGLAGLRVPLDSTQMERVVENLLSNAVKFTDRRQDRERMHSFIPLIQLTVRTDPSRLYIEVADSGIGVPADEREKIFDRYYQSTRTSLKEHGGSGIGLAFAKEMVELHHGNILVEDSEFGGSKFVIALPLSQDVELTGAVPVEKKARAVATKSTLDVPYPPEQPDKINTLLPSIVVAEDNPDVAQIIVNMLKHEYNVFFASNGRRALELLKAHAVDCVLSDIVMPEMKGDELVAEIRKDENLKNLPVFVLSSHGDEDTVLRLIEAGANDYFTKPWNRTLLLNRVKGFIRFYRLVAQEGNAQRLQELGQIASENNHQMKNRLGNLIGYQELTQFALEAVEALKAEQPELANDLKRKIESCAGRGDRGYRDTKAYVDIINGLSRGEESYDTIDVGKTVADMLFLKKEPIKIGEIVVEVEGVEGLTFQGYSCYSDAVLNLVSNAIDAVAKDATGKIWIHGQEAKDQVLLSVKDNGHGIAKEDLERLGQPFYTTKEVGKGTGLGLFLVRKHIEMMNSGKLIIESEGPGKGATFTIIVPKVVPKKEDKGTKIHGVKL